MRTFVFPSSHRKRLQARCTKPDKQEYACQLGNERQRQVIRTGDNLSITKFTRAVYELNVSFCGVDVLKKKTRNITTASLITLLLIERTFSRFVNQMNLIHRIILYVFKNHFNIVLLLMTRSVEESLSGFRLEVCVYFSSRPCTLHVPPISNLWSGNFTRNYISSWVQGMKSDVIQFSQTSCTFLAITSK